MLARLEKTDVRFTLIVVLAAVLLVAGIAALSFPFPTALERSAPAAATPQPPPNAPAGELRYRGMAMQMRSGFGPKENYLPVIAQARDLGADTVLLSTAGFMEHAHSQVIFVDVRKSPTPEDFKSIIRAARDMGLRVIVMPILLFAKPHGNEWRGMIEPPDWPEWWRQYQDFVVHFADIARDGGADGMMVGSELISTEQSTAQWQKVIAAVREHFPQGQLGYSANWDHYKPIAFWDKLDFIGMTTYYTLTKDKEPTVDQMVEGWKPIKSKILEWQRTVKKPLVFTEVGWCSQEGACASPWNYYLSEKCSAGGLEEQKRLYEAFVRVWTGVPEVSGVIWWELDNSRGGPTDPGYTPIGKPAEMVLREWFRQTRKGDAAEMKPPKRD